MRILVMLYGVISYFIFFIVFLYLIAFIGDIFVPKTISSETTMNSTDALLINIGLMLLWSVQHSVMARGWFKKSIAKVIPHHIERSTYVLISSVVLIVLMAGWQPMEGILWQVSNPLWVNTIWSLFALAWAIVLFSSFLTDHFDLFGLRQSWLYFVKKSYTPVKFSERLLYRWIRHPMMLGLLVAFWSVPTMTIGHFVFSFGMSAYTLIGIYYEERGLAKSIGTQYAEYQERTSKVIPKLY